MQNNNKSIIPPNLQKGDKICLIATARKVSLEEMQAAIQIFESWGLSVVFGQNLFAENNQFAGSDLQRAADLQNAILDNEIKAIVCARGGYGTTRMMDLVDFSPLLSNPKWLVGFSDVTALLIHLEKMRLASIHGIMPILFAEQEAQNSILALEKLLFSGQNRIQIHPNILNKKGKVEGILVGGNLSIISHLMGTETEIDTNGKLLFFEDLDEYLYHIDRMMVQLKRANKLSGLNGLLIGHFSSLKDNKIPFGKTLEEIVLDSVKDYDFPVCFGFPVGHAYDNFPLICGQNAVLEVNSDKVLLFQ